MNITEKFYNEYVSAVGSLPYSEFMKHYKGSENHFKKGIEYDLYDFIKFNTLIFDLATNTVDYSFNSSDFESLCITIHDTTFLIFFDPDIFDSKDYMLDPDFFDDMNNVLTVLRSATIKDFKIL